jgi:hypothetical protein
MTAQFDFRALLVKIQDRLSDGDRQRLHFLFGDNVPRNLRDDQSAGGALRVLESLFDKAIINDQDCDYLIEAFKNIHCHNAVQKLQGLFISIPIAIWNSMIVQNISALKNKVGRKISHFKVFFWTTMKKTKFIVLVCVNVIFFFLHN